MRRGFGQDQEVLQLGKVPTQEAEIGAALGGESFQPIQLGECAGRLHVGNLQIEAQVRVGVLVIVAQR